MKPSSQTVTRLAFVVVIAFVLAQVLWWMVFQERYLGEVSQGTLAAWSRDLALANALLDERPGDAALIARLEASYLHLSLGERFELDRAAVSAFEARQRRHLRMFRYEGPFFLLVVLLGLWIIGRNLRAEREMKRRQGNFLSAVSHEFRTPIGTLKLLVETALYRPLEPAKRRDYLEAMQRELARLEATSEQVLASARLEHGGEPPVMEAAELGAVVQGVAARSRAGLEARGAVLELLLPREPLPVSLDPAAFAVVLGNLLDNAVKYTPQPVKPVRLRLEAQGHLVVLHVEDEGVGVSAQERSAVFDKFYRVGNELTRESAGMGLGLHLVKTITEAMNGWVRCEAREGGGSRFTVVLPRRAAARAERPALESAP
jgi:signal transduction histidine kinase